MTARLAPQRTAVAAPDAAVSLRPSRRRPWLVFTVVVLAAFFGLIGSRISLDRSAFDIDRLEDEVVAARARNLELQLEIAELRDPARIAARAEAMGLTYPRHQLTLDVSPGGAAGTSPADVSGAAP